jgi:hypothetical protein
MKHPLQMLRKLIELREPGAADDILNSEVYRSECTELVKEFTQMFTDHSDEDELEDRDLIIDLGDWAERYDIEKYTYGFSESILPEDRSRLRKAFIMLMIIADTEELRDAAELQYFTIFSVCLSDKDGAIGMRFVNEHSEYESTARLLNDDWRRSKEIYGEEGDVSKRDAFIDAIRKPETSVNISELERLEKIIVLQCYDILNEIKAANALRSISLYYDHQKEESHGLKTAETWRKDPVGQVFDYKNSGSGGKHCRVKLGDGKDIFVSFSKNSVRIQTMKWRGIIPDIILVEFSPTQWRDELDDERSERMYTRYPYPDFLDSLKELLIRCDNLDEAKSEFRELFPATWLKY